MAALEAETGARVAVEQVYHLFGPEDEPLFGQQWHLENSGQTGGLTDADIDATSAWKSSLGTGTLVAVVDSGVDPGEPRPRLAAPPWGARLRRRRRSPAPRASGTMRRMGQQWRA